jgi:hypothetical protein
MLSPQEFDEFVKHYNWEYMRNPDYRVGQAFLNWCPTIIRKQIATESGQDVDSAAKLFYNTSNEECWNLIRKYVK